MKKSSQVVILLALSLGIGANPASAGQQTIANPEWSFQDDFEGSQDKNFGSPHLPIQKCYMLRLFSVLFVL